MPNISVVIPAHQAETTLQRCLDGVVASGFSPHDIIVVDDGSRDATQQIAKNFGVRVVSNAAPLRPARARNCGVEATKAPIILFVDADVVLHGAVRKKLEAHFDDPNTTGVIGSYDDRADGGSVVSDYRNLLHHYVHQRSSGETPTFWTGIGAVRREAFLAAGGFKSEWENIEDVELGLRLTEGGGRVLLDPEVQGTHLKVWTPMSMFRTDLYGRAIPWSRLLRDGRLTTRRLNTTLRAQIAALGILAAGIFFLVGPFWWPAFLVAALGIGTFVIASWDFFRALCRIRGWGFALRAVPYHALHYLAALLGYGRVRLLGH